MWSFHISEVQRRIAPKRPRPFGLPPKWGQARREEHSLVIPNKRRATRHGPNLGATPVLEKTQWAGAALARSGVTARLCGMTTSRSLRLVSPQSGHRRVDQNCVNRPLPLFPYIFPICASKSSKSVLVLPSFRFRTPKSGRLLAP